MSGFEDVAGRGYCCLQVVGVGCSAVLGMGLGLSQERN